MRVGVRSAGSTSTAELTQSMSFSVTASSSTAIRITLTPNVASPQSEGSSIVWSASVTGGVAPYQFKWSLYNSGRWSDVTQWSGSSTWLWRPASQGQYQIRVAVRSAGVTSDTPDASATDSFRIRPGAQ